MAFQRLVAVAVCVSVAQPALGAERELASFKPASVWQMDYADDSCRLSRTFAGEGGTVTLVLERFEPDDGLTIALISDALKRYRNSKEITFAFGPGGEERSQGMASATLDDGRTYYSLGTIALVPKPDLRAVDFAGRSKIEAQPIHPEAESAAAKGFVAFDVTAGFSRNVRLELDSMEPPITAMQSCVEELVGHWGIDVERHRTMSRRAVPAESPGKWLGRDAFPQGAAWNGRGGRTAVRLMVDETGKPTSCHVQRRAEAEAFNTSACNILMRNGKFRPALDADGRPMPSYYVTTFVFF